MSVLEEMKEASEGQIVRDRDERGSVKGLHLRVRGGKKVFRLYYRSKQGVPRFPKIGELGAITLAQARNIAKELLEKVAKGEDPQGEWKAARGEMTVSDLFWFAWKRHYNKPRFQKSGYAREVENLFKANIENPLGRIKVTALTRAEVKAWHQSYEKVIYTGNRSLEVLTKIFNIGEEEGIIPRNSSPCWKVKGFTERKRKRYATPAELSKLLAILERDSSIKPNAVAFIYMILFTGSRPSALERVTLEDLRIIESGGKRVGILSFAGKSTADSGEDEVVIVPPEALKILENMPVIKGGTLFGIKNPRRYWVDIRKEAGCPDLWSRDLRRTFATVGMSGGVDKNVIGRLLNHSSSQTTDIYAMLDLNARIEAASTISDKIMDLKKVVGIR